MKPLPVLQSLLFLLLGVLCRVPAPAQEAARASGPVDVRAFGAVGDGKADDSPAFLRAVAEGRRRQEPVRVPAGTYRLTQTLVLERQTLVGEPSAAWPSDEWPLPTLLPDHTGGPAVRLLAGGAVSGLGFRYAHPKPEPTRYPPCIELAGVGVRVSDVKIYGAWIGIASDGKANIGRATVENVFIADAHMEGVRMGGSWDASTLRNVEVWSPGSKTFAKEGVGFRLLKNDVLRLSDCFVFNAQTGYRFEETAEGPQKGGTWGSLANCTADFCSVAVEVRGEHTLTVSGGTFWTHFGALKVTGRGAKVMVSGAELRANGAAAVEVAGGRAVTLAGCRIERVMKEFAAPAVLVRGGESLAISGCIIEAKDAALRLEKGAGRVVCTGCVLEAGAEPAVDDRTGGASPVLLQNNLSARRKPDPPVEKKP